MKNILFIIGNGFDLAHELPTSYRDFFNWYLKGIFESLKTNRNYEDPLIKFQSRDLIPNKFSYEEFNNIYFDLPEPFGIKITPKSKYFASLLERFNTSKNTWTSFERDFYFELTWIYRSIRDKNVLADSLPLDIDEPFKQLKIKFIEYIGTISITPEKFNKNISARLNRIIDNATKPNPNNKIEIQFLNFNYTDTLNLYLPNQRETDSYKITVNHIHGNVVDPDSIIFGYGDEMDEHYKGIENLNSNKYLNHFKSFGYFKGENYSTLESFLGSNLPFDVYIVGHSCGLSDRTLLKHVFQQDKCEKIYIVFHKKSDNTDDHFERTQEISRHFDNKTLMRTRVVNREHSYPLID